MLRIGLEPALLHVHFFINFLTLTLLIFVVQLYALDHNIKIIQLLLVLKDALIIHLQIIRHGTAQNGVTKATLLRNKIILVLKYVLPTNMVIKKSA